MSAESKRLQVHAKGARSDDLSGTFAKGFPEVQTTVQCRISLTTTPNRGLTHDATIYLRCCCDCHC
jgi:hypothetical protein